MNAKGKGTAVAEAESVTQQVGPVECGGCDFELDGVVCCHTRPDGRLVSAHRAQSVTALLTALHSRKPCVGAAGTAH